ncbi:MAG: 5-(carboxyamino)imidazole ribonucleotide synthase [Akkermansiaceae bacterium]
MSILPPATIGIIGGGQLGRMLINEARRMGFQTIVFTDEPAGSPAGQLAHEEINAPFDDQTAKNNFLSKVDVCTYEFENIPSSFIEAIEAHKPVYPSKLALETFQHREREKLFLKNNDIPCAPFEVIDSAQSLKAALDIIGTPCVLKTAAFGYDGKGQIKISKPCNEEEIYSIWQELEAPRGVLEGWVSYRCEISVVATRGKDGTFAAFPVAENIHTNHILDTTLVPARISDEAAEKAIRIAEKIGNAIDYCGVFAVELFLLDNDEFIVNEVAPRPHNSGHFTIDACDISQFGMQLRAITEQHLESPKLLSPVAMVNLLGDIWPSPNQHPDWSALVHDQSAHLHLYGKTSARAGRKMGHFCVLKENVEKAHEASRKIMAKLK